jgi:anti-sigma B factor antagonist
MLSVDLSIGDVDGQAVVALRGESNLADTPSVASHLIAAVAACGPSVIVDLAGLEGIGYTGLSVLLRIRKWTRQSGGDLPLAAPQQAVRQILDATGLIDVFSVYSSVEEAADSLRQAQAWSPAAPQPLRAALVTRSAGRPPAGHAARRPLIGPPHRCGTGRPRHITREGCVKWCSAGGTTAWSA